MKKNSRVVIDTNIWISFLIGKVVGNLERVILSKNLNIIYSEELLKEVKVVVERPKFKKYFLPNEVKIVEKIFETVGEQVEVTSKVQVCRDSKDDFLLSLCQDGFADYLVTSDNDLLVLEEFSGTKIISLKEVLN